MESNQLSDGTLPTEIVESVRAALEQWSEPNNEARSRFEAGRGNREQRIAEVEHIVADSKRLTVEDLSMQINAVD